jgi:hypothetical protein
VGPGSAIRGLALLAVTAIVAAIAVPLFIQKSSHKELKRLQISQTWNAGGHGGNLSLDEVDYSNRSAVISNLPVRLGDVLLRPFPWQLSSWSQRFGFLGTVVVELTLLLLIYYLWQARGAIMARAGPFIYTTAFLLIAYSLSAGNAGTAYRYRTHVVVLAICLVVILRESVRERAAEAQPPKIREGSKALRVVGAAP